MNTYEYRIFNSVYESIKNGTKRIEFRLLNEKSNSIKMGDIINFKVIDEEKYITVKVINKYIFNNVDEIFENDKMLDNMDSSKEEFISALINILGSDYYKNKIVGIEFEVEE